MAIRRSWAVESVASSCRYHFYCFQRLCLLLQRDSSQGYFSGRQDSVGDLWRPLWTRRNSSHRWRVVLLWEELVVSFAAYCLWRHVEAEQIRLSTNRLIFAISYGGAILALCLYGISFARKKGAV